MIITTTPTIEGRPIREYKGVVFGEVISGIDFVRDQILGCPEQASDERGGENMRSPV